MEEIDLSERKVLPKIDAPVLNVLERILKHQHIDNRTNGIGEAQRRGYVRIAMGRPVITHAGRFVYQLATTTPTFAKITSAQARMAQRLVAAGPAGIHNDELTPNDRRTVGNLAHLGYAAFDHRRRWLATTAGARFVELLARFRVRL